MLQRVSIAQAMSEFKNFGSVVVVKRATGKIYIKETHGKGYAKIDENGKFVFSSEAGRTKTGSLYAQEYQTAEKRMKLIFSKYEVSEFDFYLCPTNDLYKIHGWVRSIYNNEINQPMNRQIDTPVAPKPVINVNVFNLNTRKASSSTDSFRRMLSL